MPFVMLSWIRWDSKGACPFIGAPAPHIPRGERREDMSTTARNRRLQTSNAIDTIIIDGMSLIGLLLMVIRQDHVTATEWWWYIISTATGVIVSLTGRPTRPSLKTRGIAYGSFLLLMAILLVTPIAWIDGDWHWLKWLVLLFILFGGIIWMIGKSLALAFISVAMGLFLATAAGLLGWQFGNPTAPAAVVVSPSPSPSPSPSVTTKPVPCEYGKADGWRQNETYQVILGGIPKDPTAAKAKMIEQAKSNPVFVSGYAIEKKLTDAGYDANSLRDSSGCWTKSGRELATKVQGIIEASQTSVGQASSTGTNTGGDKGGIVKNSTAGVTGDRTAIVLTHPDGTKTIVLTRCGNFVWTEDHPGVPVGPTDQTPGPNPEPTPTPSTTTPGLAPKKPGEDVNKNPSLPPEKRVLPTQSAVPSHQQPSEPAAPPPVRQEPPAPARTVAPTITQAPRPAPPPPAPPTPTATSSYTPVCPNPNNPAC